MKKLLAVLSAWTILFSMAACGGKTEDDDISLTESATETETLSSQQVEDTTVTEESTATVSETTSTTAAEKTEKPSESTTVNTENSTIGENLQKYVIDIIKTGKYTMTIDNSGGGAQMNYIAVISGSNTMQKIDLMSIMSLQFIYYEGKCYLVAPNTKRYAEISMEEFQKQQETIENYAMSFDNCKLLKTETAMRGDKTYIVETYDEGDGKTTKYYFRNNALEIVGSESQAGETESQYTIKRGADESVFTIPDNYTKVDTAAAVIGVG